MLRSQQPKVRVKADGNESNTGLFKEVSATKARFGAGQGEGHRARATKPAVEDRILSLRKGGMGMLKIGRTVGVGTSVVQRAAAASPAG
jgi:hypothetical protein